MPKPSVCQCRSREATAKRREISVTWGWTQLFSELLPELASNRTGSAGCEDTGSSCRRGELLAPPWRCCQLFARPCAPRPAPPRTCGRARALRPQRTCAAQPGRARSCHCHPTILQPPPPPPLQSRTSVLCQCCKRWMLPLKWRLLASKESLGATYCMLLNRWSRLNSQRIQWIKIISLKVH